MELKLTRPIVFFDLETTGVNVSHDRIVEISLIKVFIDNTQVERTYRVNPQMPIPPEASMVHGITDEDVAHERTFKQLAPELKKLMEGCDIAGFNSNRFDIPLLAEEFDRAGVDFDFTRARFVDVQTIFHKREQRTLVAAYRFYCGKELDGAHSANADTRATLEVLKAQLDKYPDLPNDIEELAQYSSATRNVDLMGRIVKNDEDIPVFNFGQHKGKPVAEVITRFPGYYDWMMNGDFPGDTKRVLTRIKLSLQR